MSYCEGCATRDRHVDSLEKALAEAKAEVELHRRKASGEYWVWQGDGSDHPESLACPVLMHQEDLRKMLAEIERLNTHTYCAYCGKGFSLSDNQSPEAVGEHIRTCPDHPMRKVEAENAALKAENEWLKGQLKNDPNGQRGVMCVYCGQTVPYSPAEGIQAAIDAATAHDKVCERNPLVARVATLEGQAKDMQKVLPATAVYLRRRFADSGDFWVLCEIADAISAGHLAWICPECEAPNSVQNDSCWNCTAENALNPQPAEGEQL